MVDDPEVYVLVEVEAKGKDTVFAHVLAPLQDELEEEDFNLITTKLEPAPVSDAIYKYDGRKKKYVLQRAKEETYAT